MIDGEEIRRLMKKGLLYGEIADELEIPLEDVIALTGGFRRRSDNDKKAEDALKRRRKDVVRLKKQGLSVAEIAGLERVSKKLIEEDLLYGGYVEKPEEDTKAEDETKEDSKDRSEEDVPSSFSETPEEKYRRRREIVKLREEDIPEEEIFRRYSGVPREVISGDIRYIKRNRITNPRQVLLIEPVQKPKTKEDTKPVQKLEQASPKKRGTRRKRNKEVDGKIIEMYFDATVTNKDIAEAVGISTATLYAYTRELQAEGKLPVGRRPYPKMTIGRAKKASTKKRGTRRKRNKEVDGKIIEMYFDATVTNKDIAEAVGISTATLYAYTRELQAEGKLPVGRRPYPKMTIGRAKKASTKNEPKDEEPALKTKAKLKELLKKGETRAVLNAFSKMLEDPKLPKRKRSTIESMIGIINQLSKRETEQTGEER